MKGLSIRWRIDFGCVNGVKKNFEAVFMVNNFMILGFDLTGRRYIQFGMCGIQIRIPKMTNERWKNIYGK